VIAESLGFTRLGIYEGVNELYGDPPGCRGHVKIPHYPESLDACAEFEKTLTDEEWDEYVAALWLVVGNSHEWEIDPDGLKPLVRATAFQRCIAFLKVKGLWEEGE
jgi:hypothetical protein